MSIFQRSVRVGSCLLLFGNIQIAFAETCAEMKDGYVANSKDGIIEVETLLAKHRSNAKNNIVGQKVEFVGVDGRDVYNPTKPFVIDGKMVMAARVESRHSETDSQVVFFEKSGHAWRPVEGIAPLKLQDPFYSKIKGEFIVGGVETYPQDGGGLGYRTVFYRGTKLNNLARFREGPAKMKDVRLVELPDGRIGLFTRPQGQIVGTNIDGGRGRIGFRVIDKITDLTAEVIRTAPLLNTKFLEVEWLGGNEAVMLANGQIGVVGHIANFDASGGRHYYPISFLVNPATGKASGYKMLLERADLPGGLNGTSKREDLRDVLFSGGIERNADGSALLYVGAGDAEVYSVRINDPWR